MTARSFDPREHLNRLIRADQRERGSVLPLVALALIVLLASAGLAIDLGRGYLTKLRLARAVDAGALAGARELRIRDEENAAREVRAVVRANGINSDWITSIAFPTNPTTLERMVVVSAAQTIETTFMRVVQIDTMDVAARAEAAVAPIDVALVLDLSSSLRGDPFVALKDGALSFVGRFDDEIDQMGLVGFSSAAAHAVELNHDFQRPIRDYIQAPGFLAGGNTHMQEGLRLGKEQITGPQAREEAAKVVVFFTDGLPTSARGIYGDAIWGFRNRTLVVHQVEPDDGLPTIIAGYYNVTDGIVPPWGVAPPFVGAPCPREAPTCFGLTPTQIQDEAGAFALEEATQIRLSWDASVFLYVIALGNVQIPFLCEMANATGPTGGPEDCDRDVTVGQPQGRVLHTENPDDLVQLFNEVARDLLVRLAR